MVAVVCLAVCAVPDPKSGKNSHSNLKIGRKEAGNTGDPWPHLQVKGSKTKVTKPLNVVTKNGPYIFGTGRSTNFQLRTQMEHDGPHHRQPR